jgi:hypothetical protein
MQPKASIRELMDAEIDPSADVLWNSVSVTISVTGEHDKQPQTAEEWLTVRRSAITLVEATNLLMMENRRVATDDAESARPGELSPKMMQQRIDANRAAFDGFVQALRSVAIEALEAIDAKDPARLMDAGGKIDQVCEDCHLAYWYPPDAAPKN